MANWYGSARSNYVQIKDMEGLIKALGPFNIEISESRLDKGVCFLVGPYSDDGGWPSFATDEEGDEIEFDPSEHICPFMQDDQILIMMQCGAEKLRYITGDAQAYNSEGVCEFLSLDSIYARAALRFKVDESSISRAEY